ncbi:GyrI-like domain-containing protein [Luteimonas sp BLCC-B24]|uniref:AraC family transcriptional regulator n=1 Tax=Luteimonas sp. BLCC-B24 TaxID=3025317 RepID=UPI00234C2C3C|nr:GyrI-like domain-containing protein [Luteimonas sp. BLCC-B24]MDC7806109.1 GyrI-like domain-containing protein [Luteimonas sp. BLCC-B24]
MKADTRTRLAPRIAAVAGLLQDSVAEGAALPPLETLARRACLSPFHFHRVWRAMTGEPLGRTVTRLRLSRALQLLAAGETVTRAALAVGYASPQALARTFRQTLDITPAALRGQSARATALLDRLQPPSRPACEPLRVERVEVAPFEVVALRARGAFDDLDAAFGRLVGWAEAAGAGDGIEALIGLPLGDHRDLPPHALRFEAALRVPVPGAVPRPLRRLTIGGGRYARVRHVGAYSGLEDTTDRLLAQWWPGSGERLRDAPLHYHFLDDPEQVADADLRADILLPLDD